MCKKKCVKKEHKCDAYCFKIAAENTWDISELSGFNEPNTIS